MKQINSAIKLKTIVLAGIFCVMNQGATAQEKVHFSNVTQIKASQIEMKQRGRTAVKFIKSSTLKNGQNSLTLSSGRILYVEYANRQIKSLTLTKSDGTKLGALTRRGMAVKFSPETNCNGLICICEGDDDCNDMFSTAGLCGDAVCLDNICICARL